MLIQSLIILKIQEASYTNWRFNFLLAPTPLYQKLKQVVLFSKNNVQIIGNVLTALIALILTSQFLEYSLQILLEQFHNTANFHASDSINSR